MEVDHVGVVHSNLSSKACQGFKIVRSLGSRCQQGVVALCGFLDCSM